MPGAALVCGIVIVLVMRGLRPGARTGAEIPPTITIRTVLGFVGLLAAIVWPRYAFAEPRSIPPALGLLTLAGVAGLVCAHEVVAHLVLVPLGAVRTTWWLERLAGGSIARADRPASADLAAACIVAAFPTRVGARFVEKVLARHRELPPAGVAAQALLAASRGAIDEACDLARVLVRGAETSPRVRALASDLLAAEMVASGDLETLAGLSAGWLGPRARWLGALARRQLGRRDASSRLALAALRVRMPAWWRASALVRVAPISASTPPPLTGALGPYLALIAMKPPAIRAEHVVLAAHAIDALLVSASERAEVARRALALGLDVDAALVTEELASGLVDDVVALLALRPIRFDAPDASPSLERIRAAVRSGAMARVEMLVADIRARTRERRDLAQVDEWRAWGAIREAIDRAELDADVSDTSALHAIVFAPLTDWVARLVNVRDLRLLARDACLRLLPLAERAHDVRAGDVLRRNAAACLASRMPVVAVLPGVALGTVDRAARVRVPLRVAAVSIALVSFAALASGSVAWFWLGMAISVSLFALSGRLIATAHTPDGLQLQTTSGRATFVPGEARLFVLPAGLVIVRLARPPHWLGGTYLTLAASSADASRVRDALWDPLPSTPLERTRDARSS